MDPLCELPDITNVKTHHIKYRGEYGRRDMDTNKIKDKQQKTSVCGFHCSREPLNKLKERESWTSIWTSPKNWKKL